MNQRERINANNLVYDINELLQADPHADFVASMDVFFAICKDIRSLANGGKPSSVLELRGIVRNAKER